MRACFVRIAQFSNVFQRRGVHEAPHQGDSQTYAHVKAQFHPLDRAHNREAMAGSHQEVVREKQTERSAYQRRTGTAVPGGQQDGEQ